MARLPRLPASVDQRLQVYWQRLVEAQEATDAAQNQLIEDVSDLLATIISLNELITQAEEAIDDLGNAAGAIASANELTNSYATGLTITATDAGSSVTITISAHTRVYPKADGSTTNVAVTGGSITGQAYSTDLWIYYDQASRAGGAVSYQVSTSPIAQTGDRHSIGAIKTVAALDPPKPGNPIRPPGYQDPL
jgi:hypothetical protein